MIPAGLYRVVAPRRQTSPSNQNDVSGVCLLIPRSGVHLRGAGPRHSVIMFRSLGDQDPATNWQIVDGSVWRGPAIQIHGGQTAETTIRDISLSSLTLDGGAGYTGVSQSPAQPNNGDGWDVTHKGVRITEDRYVDGVKIENCVIRRFRGELVYQGGPNGGALWVTDCELYDSNADAVSSSMSNTVMRCRMHRLAFDGIECAYYGTSSIYLNNLIYDCDGEGVSLTSVIGSNSGRQLIRGNTVRNCRVGFLATNPYNVTLQGNCLIDCGWVQPHHSNRGIWLRESGAQGGGRNVSLYDNEISVDKRALDTGLILEAQSPARWIGLSGGGLRFARTNNARQRGFDFERKVDRTIGAELLPAIGL